MAELTDAWRIFPRFFLCVYLGWIIHLTDWMVHWFMKIPAVERTTTVTTFVSIITTGVFGLFVWIYKIYSNGGRDWEANPADSSQGTEAK